MIDPGLRADLHSEKPWTMSPLLCAMNIFAVSPSPESPVGALNQVINISEESVKASRNSVNVLQKDPSQKQFQASLGRDPHEPLELPAWEYCDGTALEENNTLFSGGRQLDSEARKVFFFLYK
jgi:hypothetical protein